MRYIDYLYINIYSLTYRDGFHNKGLDPVNYSGFCLGLAIGSWYLGIVGYHVIRTHTHFAPVHKLIAFAIMIVSSGMLNWYYSYNDRYLNLYTEYKTQNKLMSKAGTCILLGGLLVLPYSLIGIALF